MPRHSLRVTDLVITENEFPARNARRYDLFPTRAYAATNDPSTEVGTFYDVNLPHGAADEAAFDSQLRPLRSLRSATTRTPTRPPCSAPSPRRRCAGACWPR